MGKDEGSLEGEEEGTSKEEGHWRSGEKSCWWPPDDASAKKRKVAK